MWLSVGFIYVILQTSTSESPFSIDFTCSNQVFDISSLECSSCDSSLNLTSSLDKSVCLRCDESTNATYNASSLQCECDYHNQYVSDLEDRIICSSCPTDHTLSMNECVLCESPKVINVSNYECVCPASFVSTQSGNKCISQSNASYITSDYDLTSSKQVIFTNLDTSESIIIQSSDLFEYYFLHSAVHCKIYNDVKACQVLGNLCVLTMYNKLHNACILFIEISNSISSISNNIQNWKQNLPFLFYVNHNIISSTSLSTISVNLNSELTLYLVKYSMNGTMIGHQEISNELFYFCRDNVNTNQESQFTKIGHNTDISCSYDLSSEFNSNTNDVEYDDMIFYDPFIYIESNDMYYPIPIYVENIDNNDGYKMVRRFFLSDHISSNNEIINYIKSVTFKVTVYDGNKIYPPLIQIRYGQLTDINSNTKTVDISFNAYYTKDRTGFRIAIIVLFVITLIIIVIVWMFEIYKYQRIEMNNISNGNVTTSQQIDLYWFIRMICVGFGVSSNIFFYLLFFISSYCYLSYKGKSKIQFLLPESDDSMIVAFKALITYSFLAKLFHVLMLIWDQCRIDVFFVDWEKPKGNIMAMLQQQQFIYQQKQQQQQQQHSMHNSMQNQFYPQQHHSMQSMNSVNNGSNMNINMKNEYMNQNSYHNINMGDIGIISCWRKLFVANEWNERSIHRNITPSFPFFIFLLFMIGVDLEYLSLEIPITSRSSNSALITPNSIVYKFVISTFFLIIIYLIEYLYYFFVNDRFFGSDPYIDLIDLSSLANISIFVLDTRYHGFYIHGKTIHQHADTSLEIINKNIENERKNLCKSRGLFPDKDTFEIFVSAQFRRQYDEMYRDVLQYELNNISQRPSSFESIRNNNQRNPNEKEKNDNILLSKQLIESSKLLSMFLCDFIEKSCPHIWEIRELIGFERFLGAFPDLSMEKNSIFYEDVMYRFKTKLMYIGLQYHLVILSILSFAFIDNVLLNTNNTVISILITYIIDYILMKIRSYFGERNLSRKTMIDEKFLL